MATSQAQRVALAAATVLVALALAGCSRSAQFAASPLSVSASGTVASATVLATASPMATASPAPTSSSATSTKKLSRKSISASDAAAIDAELSAIQKELGKLDVPGTSDFDSIGSGLK